MFTYFKVNDILVKNAEGRESEKPIFTTTSFTATIRMDTTASILIATASILIQFISFPTVLLKNNYPKTSSID